MSKKLIAVAAAAALALTGLVGVAPATALPVSGETQLGANSLLVTSTVDRGGSGTLAAPYTVAVPQSGLATSGTTLRFSISATASRPYTVTTTSGIKVLAAVTNTTAVVLTGADSLSGTTNASGSAEFFAYPTSTTAGVVTLTFDGSDITQVYVTGTVGDPYNLVSVTLPTFELSKAGVVTAVVTDAFGNAVTTGTLTTTVVGTGVPASTTIAYSETSKRFEGTITPGAVAGQLAVGVVLTVSAATVAQKAAFGDPKVSFFGIASIAAAQTVAQLTAQVAALTAQLANSRGKDVSVTKKKYNTLARKWNRANPTAKVALKK